MLQRNEKNKIKNKREKKKKKKKEFLNFNFKNLNNYLYNNKITSDLVKNILDYYY